jgi:perosamine synthetase
MKFQRTISFIKQLYPNQDFIPLHAPVFIGNEKKYLNDTIDSTYVSSVGAYVDRFEQMMREYTGAKYAIAVVNGTAALHLALQLAGVKQGDLVITQALSFVATCNAISYLKAEPVFIDVDEHSMGLSAKALKAFLEQVDCTSGHAVHRPSGKRIAACVPMHTFGFPTEIDEIVNMCATFNIPVIEDAAESIGTYYKGMHTGRFGKLGTFSFNGNKTITCGGGGIIITDDEELGPMAKHLSTQAKVPHRWAFEHDHIGYNYRCPNLNAALACAQLEQLERIIANKRDTAHQYKEFFSKEGLQFVIEPNESRSNYWLNTLLMTNKEERNEFLSETNNAGVMTRPAWTLMNKLPMFKHCLSDDLLNSQRLEDCIVNIPSSYRP